MKVELPESFLLRMRSQLSEKEYEALIQEYEKESYRGLRINTAKIPVRDFLALTPFSLTPVPWTENGFYYDAQDMVTKHPHYYAGLYYIQEPSAMLPASRLPISEGDVVLDLCAAPGGKSTELASRLNQTGLLVANDVSASRARALVKNLAVWGAENTCVTGETPEKLWQAFGCYFDKILVDAPCSGEGMFRRDAGLITSWQQRGPEEYASIQREILEYALKMLRPGGYLIYSTCTFSETEDEDTILALLEDHPEMSLQNIVPYDEGFTPGKEPASQCVRVWPYRMKGEGHFLALLKKESPTDDVFGETRRISAQECEKSWKKAPEPVTEFLKKLPDLSGRGVFSMHGEQCYFLPPYHLPEKLRYLNTGIFLGSFQKKRFEPSQALAMTLRAEEFDSVLNLSSDDERVIRYLKGETIVLTEEEEPKTNGFMLVCLDSYGLGWGKYTGGMLKNKYYAGWRMQ